jgi:uncharacterized repeat protein (TIGR02543 family)
VTAPSGTSFTISYDVNGGSSTTPSNQTVGQVFSSWSLAGYGSISSSSTNPTTYTYAAGNGTLTANYGNAAAITLPTTPSRAGYTFNGWYTAASGGTKAGNAGASYVPTATIKLYAQWTACAAGTYKTA